MKKLITIVALIAMNSFVYAGDIEAGKKAYATCVNCHGAEGEGNTTLNAPSLAGQFDWYLKRHLNYYREGIRGKEKGDVYGSQMAAMSLTLVDDAGVDNVVAYIGTFSSSKPAQTIQGDAAKGEALYAVCSTCHGAQGEGNVALNSPVIAGQHDWYLARQLKYYKNGARGANPKDLHGATMVGMAATLADDQAINDVVSYISTFPAP